MCTASWFFHSQGYHLFFNRDEKHTRATALPPSVSDSESGSTIMPLDPDGGGSWLGVNASGWTYALLNFYQGQVPKGNLISRGSIVKQALLCHSIDRLESLFHTLPLMRTAPFSLLCLAPPQAPSLTKPPEQIDHQDTILCWCWTGRHLQRGQASRLLTSSSVNLDQVQQSRISEARHNGLLPTGRESELCQRDPDGVILRSSTHRNFHRTHAPSRGAMSVCMHRDDASTVSFSEIAVSGQQIEFTYIDGAPCSTAGKTTTKIPVTFSSNFNHRTNADNRPEPKSVAN